MLLGLSEGLGLLMLLPFLELAGVAPGGAEPGRLSAMVGELFGKTGIPMTLGAILLVFLGVIALRAILLRSQTLLNAEIEQGFVRHLRSRLYAVVANADWLFLTRTRAADVTHALTSELQRVTVATNFFLRMISMAVLALVHVAVALLISPPMALVTAVAAGLLALLLRPQTRQSHEVGGLIRSASEQLYTAILEHLGSLKVAKGFGLIDSHVENFDSRNHRVKLEIIKFYRIQAKARLVYEIGAGITLAIILYAAIEFIHVPISSLLVLVFLFARLLPKATALNQSYNQIVGALPAFEAVLDLEARATAARETRPSGSVIPLGLAGGVELRSVSFRYDSGGGEAALADIDLVIPAKKMTAIIGHSGAGKTTLADILLGLLKPAKGEVLIDGIALEGDRLHAWRRAVGYVPQDTFLFNDTIRGNLLWACPEASEADIADALELAACSEFIAQLPAGLETNVGDRGVKLSGGEKQRLSLARAVLRRPSLLMLDEATSALDEVSEARIRDAIERLRGEMTVVLIAHRLTTIRRADLIVVLRGGRLVETGTWEELADTIGGDLGGGDTQ